MKNARIYVNALPYQKKVLEGIRDYADSFNKVTPGYVSTENLTESSIDVIIGSERFTILSTINSDGTITFNVFIWKFDLSSLTRYTDKKVDTLTFQRYGSYLRFLNDKAGYDYKISAIIANLDQQFDFTSFEFLFDVFEIYIDEKDKPVKAF